MRKILAVTGVMAAAFGSSAAYACDMEGFGFTRMNPFAQHGAMASADASAAQKVDPYNLTVEAEAPAETATATTQSASSQQTAQANSNTQTASADASTDQAKRFTATKD